MRIVVIILASVFVGVRFYSWNAQRLGGDSMPMPFGIGASIVLSGSMEPELEVDDLIIVKQQDEYFVGDMVVFQSHGVLIVHRIIAMDGETVITQGDANNTADDPIQLEDIKGSVICTIPSAGVALNFLRSPVGIFIVVGGAILLMELSIRREKKESDADLEPIKEEIRRLLAEKEAAESNQNENQE